MTRQRVVFFTLTVLTLVWAVGVSSFAPASFAQSQAQQQKAQALKAEPQANEKHPIKPLPPDMESDHLTSSGADKTGAYPNTSAGALASPSSGSSLR